MYCPECGVDHHAGERQAEAAADREVTLAKISADRDIKIAQINANVARDTAETDNALSTAHAEGVAEGMETALGSGAVDGQADELAADAEPVIVEAPAEPEPEPPAPDMVPPLVETSSRSNRGGGGGWWEGYR